LLRVVLCFVRISSPFYWSMKTLVQKFKGGFSCLTVHEWFIHGIM